jgi:hypothetical protein
MLTLYVYANDNPITLVDSTGNWPELPTIGQIASRLEPGSIESERTSKLPSDKTWHSRFGSFCRTRVFLVLKVRSDSATWARRCGVNGAIAASMVNSGLPGLICAKVKNREAEVA